MFTTPLKTRPASLRSSPPPAPKRRRQVDCVVPTLEAPEIPCLLCSLCGEPNVLPIGTCENDCSMNVCLTCLQRYLSYNRLTIRRRGTTQVPELPQVLFNRGPLLSPCGCRTPLHISLFKRPLYDTCDLMRTALNMPERVCLICNEKFTTTLDLMKHQVQNCNYLKKLTCPNAPCQHLLNPCVGAIHDHLFHDCRFFTCPVPKCSNRADRSNYVHILQHVATHRARLLQE